MGRVWALLHPAVEPRNILGKPGPVPQQAAAPPPVPCHDPPALAHPLLSPCPPHLLAQTRSLPNPGLQGFLEPGSRDCPPPPHPQGSFHHLIAFALCEPQSTSTAAFPDASVSGDPSTWSFTVLNVLVLGAGPAVLAVKTQKCWNVCLKPPRRPFPGDTGPPMIQT